MSAKAQIFAGVAIILLGIGVLVYHGVSVTRPETGLRIVTRDVTMRTQISVPAPLGWALLAGGTFLIFTGAVARGI